MKLLTPIKIGPMEVKNRVVSTAHSAYLDFYRPGSDGQRYTAYQERRAEGGTGMMIMTAMHVHESSQVHDHFIYDPEDMAPKFREIAARVHSHGAKIISQLFHFGAQGKSEVRDDFHPIWGFSNTVTSAGEAVHRMTDAEIETVISAFAFAASTVVSNDIDGVELHGTHGYLIQQSFSPFANQRDDRWGQRLEFVRELLKRVREAIGPDKALGFRISAEDFIPLENGGVGHEALCQIAADVVDTGLIDYINHSEGAGGSHYARAIASYRFPAGEYLPLTRNLKVAIGDKVPLIGVGKIQTPDLAEQALQAGDCDLVGMTRAQIADPDLVHKLKTGQSQRIRVCTGANQGCIDRTGSYPITCIQNPEVGEEQRFAELEKVPLRKKHVLIVGGGPAGMKAAEIAARRGHKVTLVEASHRLGGRFNLVEQLGKPSNLLAATDWVEQELAELDVDIRLQTTVDLAFAEALAPDEIILATGAVCSSEVGAVDDGSIPVLASDQAALGEYDGVKVDLEGLHVLVVDKRGNYETCLVIEALANRGAQLTIATPFASFGANTGFTHLNYYHGQIPKWRARVLTMTSLVAIGNGEVSLNSLLEPEPVVLSPDLVVAAVHPRPQDGLYEVLSKKLPTRMIGDVVAPRSALEAFREGDRAGRTV